MTMGLNRFFKQGPGGSLNELICTEDWRLAIMECEMNPREASTWVNRTGFFDGAHDARVLPIHQACALRPPTDILETLLSCHPAGIKAKESAFHRLPLHVACQTDASLDVVSMLLEHYSDGARTKDSLGRLPLHYACSHGAPPDIVEALLRSFPGAAGCEDKNGWLPIHVAARFGVSTSVIQLLLDVFPGSICLRTKKGNTPLSCAKKVTDRNHDEVVSLLERAVSDYEKALEEKGVSTNKRTDLGEQTSGRARVA